MAVLRYRTKGPNRLGSVVLNFGGPGPGKLPLAWSAQVLSMCSGPSEPAVLTDTRLGADERARWGTRSPAPGPAEAVDGYVLMVVTADGGLVPITALLALSALTVNGVCAHGVA